MYVHMHDLINPFSCLIGAQCKQSVLLIDKVLSQVIIPFFFDPLVIALLVF